LPRALITGVTGQDGSYLAELLLSKGYEVVGVVRRTSHHSYERIEHLLDRIEVVAADLLDQHSLTVVLQETRPDEVYNLASQHPGPSLSSPASSLHLVSPAFWKRFAWCILLPGSIRPAPPKCSVE
jgi:GDP-D-mannose dehydratase